MRNKIDNILLGTLWGIASTLGICFWFNTKYGFNIFSHAHWKHLAYMQAAQHPVQISFYISMTVAVIIIIVGMYLLVRPHFRKIPIPTHTVTQNAKSAPSPQPTPHASQPKISESGLQRPARLNIDNSALLSAQHAAPYAPPAAATPTTPVMTAPVMTAPPAQQPQATSTPRFTPPDADLLTPEMQEIFESAGYKTLPAPRVSGLQTSVLALGLNETLWIGAIDIETSTMDSIVNVIDQVFKDTLEDIPIHINSFVVNAADAQLPKSGNVLTFANLSELQEYMSSHTNPPIPADESENFDAFASYISTVTDYLRTL